MRNLFITAGLLQSADNRVFSPEKSTKQGRQKSWHKPAPMLDFELII